MAKNCPINEIEALNLASPMFKGMIDKYNTLDITTPDLYNVLYRKLSDLSPQGARYDLGSLFIMHLEKTGVRESLVSHAQDLEAGTVELPTQLGNLFDDFGVELTAFEDAIESSDPNDGETQDYTDYTESGTSKHLRDNGDLHFKDIIMGALDVKLTKKEYHSIVAKAQEGNINKFIDFLIQKFLGYK